ncbi:hypothetical protein BHM03_00053439 [Ensete ventricosum]|nr:hypothetical protein BHM03_00053439 [Ensete ventricosum]
MAITPSVSLLWSGFHRVGCPEEAFHPDLKEDFGPGRIEGDGRSLGMAGLGLSILLLEGPKSGAWAHHLLFERRYMLRQVGAAVIRFERWVPKIMRDRLVLDLLDKGRSTRVQRGTQEEVVGSPHQVAVRPRVAPMRVVPPVVPLERSIVMAPAIASAEECGG